MVVFIKVFYRNLKFRNAFQNTWLINCRAGLLKTGLLTLAYFSSVFIFLKEVGEKMPNDFIFLVFHFDFTKFYHNVTEK